MTSRLNPADTLVYARQSSRALRDPRFYGTGRLREFVLAVLYLHQVDRQHQDTARKAVRMLGMDTHDYSRILAMDAPRYQPTWEGDLLCPVPTPRKPACHRRGTLSFRVTDPTTGQWKHVGYCARHHTDAAREQEHERRRLQAGVPEPVPTAGGLLLCYLPLNAHALEKAYRWARPGWEKPSWGMRADDWPAQAATVRPTLTAVPTPGGAPQTPTPSSRPRLKLITT